MRTIVFILLGLTTTALFGRPIKSAIACQDKPNEKPALVFPHHQPVTGRIVDEDGWPVVGAVVIQNWKSNDRYLSTAQRAPNDICNRAATDVTGKFKFDKFDFGMPHGMYVFHRSFGVTQIRDPLHFFSDIVMFKGEKVSCRILTHDGLPIEGAKIRTMPHIEKDKLGFEYGVGTTDGEGICKLDNVLEGQVLNLSFGGGFEVNLLWKMEGEFSQQDFSNVVKEGAFGKEFEYRLPKLQKTELVVKSASDGRPIEIQKAEFSHGPLRQPIQYGSLRTDITNISGSRIVLGALRKGLNQIRIYPTVESKHVVTSIDLNLGADEEVPKKIDVEILEGAIVSGRVVDESSGQPIADAAVGYESKRPGELFSRKIESSSPFVRSDEDGAFSMLVPASPARLRVIGHCGNYQTLRIETDKTPNSEDSHRLLREIDPAAGASLQVDDFQLAEGPVVTGKVLDENNRPVEGVDFMVLRNHYSILRQPIFGTTGKDGRFRIESIFTAICDENPRQNQTVSRVFFWHPELTLSKTIEVDSDDATKYTDLEVILADSPAALGRVIDGVTKQPVAGVLVGSEFFATPFRTGAISREDGTFLLEHLPRPSFRAEFSKREYLQVNEQFSFQGDKQLVVELDDIEFLKKFAFGKPDAPPDISKLNDKEALEAIVSYIEGQLKKLPEKKEMGSRNYQEPDHVFRVNLFKVLNDSIENLLDRKLSPQFQIDVAIKILQSDTSNDLMGIQPTSSLTKLQKILIHNIDRDGMLERVAAIERVFGWDRNETRLQVLDSSKDRRVRTWAATELVNNMSWKLMRGVQVDSGRVSDEVFQQSLSDVFMVWEIGLTELHDEKFFPGETIGELTKARLNSLEKRISLGGFDEVRVRLIQDAIDKLRQHE